MGHLNIVLLLLQNGASPDVRNIVSTREPFVRPSVLSRLGVHMAQSKQHPKAAE